MSVYHRYHRRSMWEYSLRRKKVLEVCEEESACTPADVAGFLVRIGLAEKEQEHFLSIVLDTRHHIRGFYTVTVGLLDRSYVHCREVFRNAILLGASKIVLAHNHPSGDITPSEPDLISTRELVAAGMILGIEVIDHVILGPPSATRCRNYLSFREENLL